MRRFGARELVGAVAALAGVAAVAAGLFAGRAQVVLAALDAGWLFCTGVSAGAVAFSAGVRLAGGGWAGPLLPEAEAAGGFLLPACALLVPLVFGGAAWRPPVEGWGPPRDLVCAGLLLVTARWFQGSARGETRSGVAAVAYLLVYVAALSAWAVDLALDLGPWAPSTVVPPFYFMTAFLAGLGWAVTAALAAGRGGDPELHHDAGKLVFGLACFWGYLLFAAYLPTWYEDIPDETGFLFARWHGAFRPLSLLALAATGLLPFVILLTEWAKLRRPWLAVAAACVLFGALVECLLLALPALPIRWDAAAVWLAAGTIAGTIGLFLLTARGARHVSSVPR